MSLATGMKLGPYEILAALGAGGMGEVYRAHDTALGRDVAIKGLPELFAADEERLARFEREARVLASLNHPNIAAIHGLERTPTATFLVMELVPGETLAAHIARGRVPIDEALPIAVQIAAALEAAHNKGIVHRDLKPANIVLTPDGKVKVLDFGLAKAPSRDAPAMDVTHSPTMAHAGTLAGVLLGTAAYMSPEQARGKPVDKRTDIWAFGCVLFEMLTATHAFEGETITDIVAAVMKNEPDWRALPADTPPALRSVLRRCLKKDPAVRVHDIADARIEIEEAIAEPRTHVPAVVGRTRGRWTRAIPWTVTAMLTLALAFLAMRGPRRDVSISRPVMRTELNLPAGIELYTVYGQGLCLSHDGTQLIFVGVEGGRRRLYLRRLDQLDTVALQSTDAASSCVFSPDGLSVAFRSADDATMKKVSLADGLVATIAGQPDQMGAAWGPDDRIVFVRAGTLWQMAAAGGPAKQLTTLDHARLEVSHGWPTVLPDGRTVLFTSLTAGSHPTSRIESVSLSSGKRRIIVERGTFPLYAQSGHLIFFRDSTLIASPFDVTRLETTGPAVRLVENLTAVGGAVPLAAVSGTGALIYALNAASNRLVSVTREGVERPLSAIPRSYSWARLAPDGRRIALQVGAGEVWVQDTARDTLTPLTTSDMLAAGFPVWTPDGNRILFRSATGIRWVETGASGRGEAIPGTSILDFPTAISSDGATLAFTRTGSADTSSDVYVLSLRGEPNPRPLIKTPAYEGGAQFSPDGRWVAYASNESGQFQVYVRPLPGLEQRSQVSTQGGTAPLWNRNGRELFYRSGNKMMAVDVSATPGLTLSQPRLLFDQPYFFGGNITAANYDISPDGQWFVMIKEEPGASRLTVVLNWFEELKARVPTAK